jgi:hypothetical protein
VTIYVGPHRTRFTVPKDKLCNASAFFKGAFCTSFKEAREREMDLPEDSPAAFSMFIHWVTKGTITDGKRQKYINPLFDLYIFSKKICMNSTELEDRIMDKIQDASYANNRLPNAAMVRKAFQNTAEGSYLRLYCVLAILYDLKKKVVDRRYLIEGSYSFRKVMKKDLDKIFALCKENDDLFKRILYGLHDSYPSNRAWDPRRRNDRRNRCFFHRHRDGECYRDVDSEEDDSKDGDGDGGDGEGDESKRDDSADKSWDLGEFFEW